MHKLSYAVLASSLLTLTACSTQTTPRQALPLDLPTHALYTTTVQSWKGGSVQSLMQTWGIPSQTLTDEKGDKVYIYKKKGVKYVPVYAHPGQISPSGEAENRTTGEYNTRYSNSLHNADKDCYTRFLSPDGKTITEFVTGNTSCAFDKAEVKALYNPKQVANPLTDKPASTS